MKKEITYGQALGIAVTIIIAVFGGWLTLTKSQSADHIRIEKLELKLQEMQLNNEARYNKIEDKIDNVQNDITKILINMERKQDRK